MKLHLPAMLAVGTLFAMFSMPCLGADAQPAAVAPEGSVPITQLIADVAKRTGKTFVLDPRVQADVVVLGGDRNRLDYPGLLSVLQVYGFTAFEEEGRVNVVPEANARQLPLELITGNETRPSAQYVSKLLAVKTVPATHLVPVLRPLLPQQAHLVAFKCTNVLMIIDTFANVQRIEEMVRALDTGREPYPFEKCAAEPVAKSTP